MQEYLTQGLRWVSAQLRQRSPREQLLLAVAGFAILLTALQLLAVGPLQAALAARREEATKAAEELNRAAILAPELQRLRSQLAEVEQRVQPDESTNLQALLEQFAKEAGVNVENFRPKTGDNNDRYPESRLDVELRGATLAQTVQFLYKIESAQTYLIVRSLSVRARGDAAQLLDVTFSVSSFRRA